jgi:DNA-binding beta-propeller fold protein YncE
MNSRIRGYACALSALFISLPALVFAQTSVQFTLVPWPANDGDDAPYYRRAEVAGVETDAQGNVYLCHPTRLPVVVFDRNGNYLRSWGGGQLLEPHSIRIDRNGNVWVPDIRLHQVKVFSPTGTLLREYGLKKKRGREAANRFNGPTDVAFGPNGDTYISDGYGNSRVVHLAANGSYIGEWGSHGEEPGEFRLPHSIAVDSQGLVYVADRSNGRVQVFTPNGEFVRMWETLDTPWGLEIANGRMYIAHGYPFTVSIYDLQGNLITHQGEKSKGRPIGSFAQPHMLAVEQNYMYTAELRGHRVQKFRVDD